jgi:hypothetical protein
MSAEQLDFIWEMLVAALRPWSESSVTARSTGMPRRSRVTAFALRLPTTARSGITLSCPSASRPRSRRRADPVKDGREQGLISAARSPLGLGRNARAQRRFPRANPKVENYFKLMVDLLPRFDGDDMTDHCSMPTTSASWVCARRSTSGGAPRSLNSGASMQYLIRKLRNCFNQGWAWRLYVVLTGFGIVVAASVLINQGESSVFMSCGGSGYYWTEHYCKFLGIKTINAYWFWIMLLAPFPLAKALDYLFTAERKGA